ncbi:MAG: hypothetical protein ACTSYY_12845 [Promethearchaeota archaeon]
MKILAKIYVKDLDGNPIQSREIELTEEDLAVAVEHNHLKDGEKLDYLEIKKIRRRQNAD